jgi:hypothetical protein
MAMDWIDEMKIIDVWVSHFAFTSRTAYETAFCAFSCLFKSGFPGSWRTGYHDSSWRTSLLMAISLEIKQESNMILTSMPIGNTKQWER